MYVFIVLLGIVSFFADITYEGARSITGPFLGILGASGAVVGTVAGLGEFMGYAVRLISGKVADVTKQYWIVTFIGYTSNLVVVPLLALAHNWEIAALLVVLERVGKGIRTPARDAMLSYACTNIGKGWGFGIHEAMDRFGALIGPLVVYGVLTTESSYRLSFLFLGIPAALALGALWIAKRKNPHPLTAETKKLTLGFKGLSPTFWLFVAAASLIGAGYVDYALVAYHFQKKAVLPMTSIPLFYTCAMGSAVVFSLICGKLFDLFSKPVLVFSTAVATLAVPLLFLGNSSIALIGMIIWGIGIGMQGSILRSVIALIVPTDYRSSAYGMFGVAFGLFWFLGSALLGWLYDHSIGMVILVSIGLQLAAIPLLLKIEIPSQRDTLNS